MVSFDIYMQGTKRTGKEWVVVSWKAANFRKFGVLFAVECGPMPRSRRTEVLLPQLSCI